ncbi:hypothetical protein V6N13_055563 [Hibiscus sabdariffa]
MRTEAELYRCCQLHCRLQPTDPRQYVLVELSNDDLGRAFPSTPRGSLPFTGEYGPLEAAADVVDRRDIALGITELRRHIQLLSYLNPDHDSCPIAKALILCEIKKHPARNTCSRAGSYGWNLWSVSSRCFDAGASNQMEGHCGRRSVRNVRNLPNTGSFRV